MTNFQKSLELRPPNFGGHQWLGRAYYEMRRYAEAETHLDRAIERRPDDHWSLVFRTMLYLSWDGNTKRAQQAFDVAFERIDLFRYLLASWDFDDALVLRIFADDLADGLERRSLNTSRDDSTAYYLAKADAAVRNGRTSVGRAYSDSARVVLEQRLALRPDNIWDNSRLGLAYAGLGRFDEAKRAGERGVELSTGRQRGSFAIPTLARMLVMTGDYDAAVDQLERVLAMPSLISVPLLRVDPVWDPLRDHPRFRRIIRK